jgi:hypothetical protein
MEDSVIKVYGFFLEVNLHEMKIIFFIRKNVSVVDCHHHFLICVIGYIIFIILDRKKHTLSLHFVEMDADPDHDLALDQQDLGMLIPILIRIQLNDANLTGSGSTLQKAHLCIPFLGISQPHSQFHIHVSVSDLYS